MWNGEGQMSLQIETIRRIPAFLNLSTYLVIRLQATAAIENSTLTCEQPVSGRKRIQKEECITNHKKKKKKAIYLLQFY